jgi:hypothetical protein
MSGIACDWTDRMLNGGLHWLLYRRWRSRAAGREVGEGAGALAWVIIRLRRAEAEQCRVLEVAPRVRNEPAIVARGGGDLASAGGRRIGDQLLQNACRFGKIAAVRDDVRFGQAELQVGGRVALLPRDLAAGGEIG